MATGTNFKNLWIAMLALNGGVRIWHVSDSTDMRYGKYRLLRIIGSKGRDPYNGDVRWLPLRFGY